MTVIPLLYLESTIPEKVASWNNPVIVTLKTKGIKHLDSCIIHWTLNGVLQTPYVYRGHLPEDFNATVTIGNYTQRSNMYDSLTIWVSFPNGDIDSTTSDDTLNIISFGCLSSISGDLIVGTSHGADFPSINEALFIISKCGVSGNVTLKLQSGTYDENWDFSNLSTIMGNYTLTVTSLGVDKDSVIIQPASENVVTLNNTNNLIISHITLDATNGNYAVNFTGTAKDILIDNCNILANPTSSSSSYGGIYNLPPPVYWKILRLKIVISMVVTTAFISTEHLPNMFKEL
jgi:hypothetical protein